MPNKNIKKPSKIIHKFEENWQGKGCRIRETGFSPLCSKSLIKFSVWSSRYWKEVNCKKCLRLNKSL